MIINNKIEITPYDELFVFMCNRNCPRTYKGLEIIYDYNNYQCDLKINNIELKLNIMKGILKNE